MCFYPNRIYLFLRIVKLTRTYIFIAIASIALLIVLFIQVNWILESAKIKEQLFTEKANMALSRTAEALRSDKEACMSVEVGYVQDNSKEMCLNLDKNAVHNIDSMLNHYMKLYNIHIDYSFELIKPGATKPKGLWGFSNNVYKTKLEEAVSKNGLELKLIFPEKRQFIIEEMGSMFITSVVLILVVMILFWKTISFLLKEKRILEHTTDFLNNMTHEFKTPLTNIGLAGKMMMKDPPKLKHYCGIILQENEKLRLQVEQMLSMTALERGEIPLQRTELDMHHLIQESLNCINLQIEHLEGEMKLNLRAEKFVVMGDKTHLINALCNLIDNGIKYCDQKPEITISTFNNAEQLIIVVADKGIGIDKEHQKHVFNKFFRVPTGNIHNVKGFGIGLAYTKKIIELHKGTIELSSEKGKGLPAEASAKVGTTFTITLNNA
jgi:two-component system phosphate regulon sensor histidine kinase PhoR